MNKCTFVASHFDGYVDALKQYGEHCPMQHVQGYIQILWMPPLGNISLRIAPAAARAPCKTMIMKKYINFAGHSNGHDNAPVRYRMHCPMEEVQGFTRSHWTPPLGKYF